MSPISLLRHSLPAALSRAFGPSPKPELQLPADVSREHRKRWSSELNEAQRIQLELAKCTAHLRDPASKKRIADAAGLREFPSRRARDLTVSDPAAGDPGALNASWYGKGDRRAGGALVTGTPQVRQSIAWAAACAEHGIAFVVDMGTPEEASRLNHCMRSSAPAVFKDHAVTFETPSSLSGHREQTRLPQLGSGAWSRQVKVTMDTHRLDGQGRREAVPAGLGSGAGNLSHKLRWLNVPSASNRAISPEALLHTCQHLGSLGVGKDQAVAFMSPGGDRRAEVFAAAWNIQREIDRGAWSAKQMPGLVEVACLTMRIERDAGAFGAKEDIASLLAFARLAHADHERRAMGR